jgi:hypothetical protein
VTNEKQWDLSELGLAALHGDACQHGKIAGGSGQKKDCAPEGRHCRWQECDDVASLVNRPSCEK